MKIIQGDILDISAGIIVHQVNCQGKFNKGLAEQIRNKYPEVYKQYIGWYELGMFSYDNFKQGMIQPVKVNESLWVINLAGQFNYGNKDVRYTDYEVVEKCLFKINCFLSPQESLRHFPFGMGCGLGGGDWKIVSFLIQKYLPDANIVKK